MPQITKDNVSLYNSFVDSSDLIVRQSDHSLASRGGQQSQHSLHSPDQPSQHSPHSPEQNGKLSGGGSTDFTGSEVVDENSSKVENVPRNDYMSRGSRRTSLSDSSHGPPPALDFAIIQNSLTHSGITEQQAVPLSRNRPASERHRKRDPAGHAARLAQIIPSHKQPQAVAVATEKSCTRNRPKSDRYVKHKGSTTDRCAFKHCSYFTKLLTSNPRCVLT